jgi:hypothetical protein
MSGRVSSLGCSHPQHRTWLAWSPVWCVLLSECDTNRKQCSSKSPAHVFARSVAMQIVRCWHNIKFCTPFLFKFFIRSWKETILPQSTVCGLKSFATWNSGKWLKFSAFHLRSPVHFHGRNRTRNACGYNLHFQTRYPFIHATMQQHNSPPTRQPTRRKKVYQVTAVPDRFSSKQLSNCVRANCGLRAQN